MGEMEMTTTPLAPEILLTPGSRDWTRILRACRQSDLPLARQNCVLQMTIGRTAETVTVGGERVRPQAVRADGTWANADRAQANWKLAHPAEFPEMARLAWEIVAILSGQRDRLYLDVD